MITIKCEKCSKGFSSIDVWKDYKNKEALLRFHGMNREAAIAHLESNFHRDFECPECDGKGIRCNLPRKEGDE